MAPATSSGLYELAAILASHTQCTRIVATMVHLPANAATHFDQRTLCYCLIEKAKGASKLSRAQASKPTATERCTAMQMSLNFEPKQLCLRAHKSA
jgi:hypothetical protein